MIKLKSYNNSYMIFLINKLSQILIKNGLINK